MELNALQPGQTVFDDRMLLSAEVCKAYREAVEDGCGLHADQGLVPSMGVAALVIGRAMDAVSLPAGAVHTGQELDFSGEVPVGAELQCAASVAQNSTRQGTRFVALDIRAMLDGKPVMTGRASIAVPESVPQGAADDAERG